MSHKMRFALLLVVALLASSPLRADGATGVVFPERLLFNPLIAYHKDPRFFISYRAYDVKTGPFKDQYTIGAVGYGNVFGLYEWRGNAPGDGVQIGFGGGLFAQFDLEADSMDLINADYTVGIPVMWRRGELSARLAFYHQSSHLGDEFLLNYAPERINLSYEAIQFVLSKEWPRVRLYGGGEYIFSPEPADLNPRVLSGGIEFRPELELPGHGLLVSGLHLESNEEHSWHVDISVSVGIEFQPRESGHSLTVVLEGYAGYAPHGQFYQTKIDYVGLGLRFGL